MDDTGPLPAQYVGARLLLHIVAQVTVRGPDDFLAQAVEVLNQFNGDTGGNYPVRTGFYRRRGISVDHHGAIGVAVAKCMEFFFRTAKIQRALCVQRRHQHLFFRAEDFGGFAHKAHAGDQ
ncbi:hypothetical protein D3C76_1285160 [compost metagenome]